jgi:uncharacterized sulfatase
MVLLLCATSFAAEPVKRPNVLFIICDDLNVTSLGCYGNTVCKTPNIDRLAARGVKFDRAYAQWPLCWPSRHSFLSGRRPDGRFMGAANFRQRVPDVTFFPEHFRNHGYFTARVGKIFHARTVMNGMTSYEDPACWDVSELGGTETDPCGYAVLFADHPKGLAAHPEIVKVVDHHELLNKAGGPGYDYWMDMSAVNLPDEQVTDGAIAVRISRLMNERAKAPDGKPFFLAAGFRRPHQLWVAPKKYFDMYPWQSIDLPAQPADDLKDIPKPALTRGAPNMTDEQRKKAIAAYYACVTMVDAQVGKLLDEMDRLKLWDDTIIVFTSDHGWHLNEHGLWGKVTLFEESAKVPLIIAGNQISRGATSPRVCEMLDFFPTLCELTGLKAPDKLEGISLVPQLKDPQAAREKPAFSVLRRGKIWGRAVYTERYRYTEWGDDASAGAELYDHQSDPKEFTNLASDASQAHVMEQLKTLLDAEIKLRDRDAADDSVKD